LGILRVIVTRDKLQVLVDLEFSKEGDLGT
jgi:hypothetical protein